MDNVSIFSIPSSSRWLINCSVKTCQALKSTEDISVLMITDFAGFDWSPRLEEEISIDLGPGAMICYCHRTTRRFEKRAELEFETRKKCVSERWQNGKFTYNCYRIESSIVVGVCVFLSVFTVTTDRAGHLHSIGKTHIWFCTHCHKPWTENFRARIAIDFSNEPYPFNLVEHYKIWQSQKSLRKSHKSLVKNNTLMINRCSGASEARLCGIVCEVGRCLDAKILTLTWSPLRWQPCLNPITPLCKLTANFASATSGDKSVGCKNIAKGTTKQSVNCAVSIFISPFILFKSWYHECMHTLALSRGNVCGEFCVWVWILTPPSNVDGFYNNQKEWSDCTKIER